MNKRDERRKAIQDSLALDQRKELIGFMTGEPDTTPVYTEQPRNTVLWDKLFAAMMEKGK